MKSLYFVRHGLSQANIDRVWSGHFNSLLVDEGRVQAAHAGQAILDKSIKISLIISSPLLRTQETARIIAETIGYPVEQILTEQLLIERTFGKLEGTASDDFFDTNTYPDVDTIEGAETVEALQNRAQLLFNTMQQRPEDTILLVSHGAFGRALRRVAEGRPYTDEYRSDWERFQIGNAEILQLV